MTLYILRPILSTVATWFVSLIGHVADLVSRGWLVLGLRYELKLTLPSQLDVIRFANHVYKQTVMYVNKQL